MPTTADRKLFVNLAVEDLGRSVEFFTRLGFGFDPRFTDENATCMILSDEAFVMLLRREFFQGFTPKPLCEPSRAEVLVAVSADSREGVDALVDAALEAGGAPAAEPQDHGVMYGRSFLDPDGHQWEVVWMDTSAVPDA